MKAHINEIAEEATHSLIDVHRRLAETVPAEHQPAIRALISSLIYLAQAVAESHQDLASRIEAIAAPPPLDRPLRTPLTQGME
jgi:hypothetical protein